MVRYEILFLTVPEITADEASSIESQVQKLVREQGGTLLSFERWGKMLLAYPVRHHDYGVYFLVRFEFEESKLAPALEALRMLFAVKLNETVMRYLVDRLDAQAPLTYARPDSLEEAPSKPSEPVSREYAE